MVYVLVKVLRNQFPAKLEPSLEAAIALRDVMVMMGADAYPSCENALRDVVLLPGELHLPISILRSQIFKAQASMTRVAKCNSTYAEEIRQIYCAPLLPQEVDDIFAAYTECAIPDTDKRAKRPPQETGAEKHQMRPK